MKKALAVLPAVLIVASAAAALDGQPGEFGVDNPSTYSMFAWDFSPIDDGVTFGMSGNSTYLRYCKTSIVPYSPFGYLEGAVHLPTGALIDHIELAACDTDATADAAAVLYLTSDPGFAPTVLGSVTTSGATGCTFNASTSIGHTVNNPANSYAVEVQLPAGNANVSLRAVRIFYKLQVSQPGGPQSFNDVPPSHPFYQFIEALHSSGITGGCGNGNYCPDAPLTRGQMAVFLAKALGLSFSN